MNLYPGVAKRLFDIILATVILVFLSPLLVLIAVLVRLKLGSPVIFRQPRPGLDGRIFTIFKFRTMKEVRDQTGPPPTDELRLTPFGRLLRSTSLDELPELVNILRGDMSLVGPRPLLVSYLERYAPEQRRRHEVRPGITGWAQVNGRNAITWEQKFRFDIWYVDHCSFWLDVRILVLTLWKILTREGISQAGQATMEEFQGAKRGG